MRQLLAAVVCAISLFAVREVQAGKDNLPPYALESTLMIQTSNGQGTAFTLDIGGHEYLITAKHLVTGLGPRGAVNIVIFDTAHNKITFEQYMMKIYACAGAIDIAVLIPPLRLNTTPTLSPGLGTVSFGQDTYFVGFPFGEFSMPKTDRAFVRPLGLVKHGLVSGARYIRDGDGIQVILDGYNIFGFSGAPITYLEPASGTTAATGYVIGVISGFQPDYGLVLVPTEIGHEDIKPEDRALGRIIDGAIIEKPGHYYKLAEKRIKQKRTNEMVLLNTGIATGYGIKPAIDLIKQHPEGPAVN